MYPEIGKIIYVKNKDINKELWDSCIYNSSNRIVFALSWYLDILCPGWDALIEGNYNSVMPIISGKRAFVHYIYNPYFSARLGVFPVNTINSQLLNRFFSAIPNKYKLISIKLNSYDYFNIKNFQTVLNKNYELVLNKPYETLFAKFSKNHKKNIQKSYKTGIIIRKETNIDGLISLKKELMFRLSNNKIKDIHFKRLKALLVYTNNNGHIVQYSAYDGEQKLCASVVFLTQFNRAVKYSATNLTGKKLRAGYALVDSFIKDFANTGVVLDFAGSNIKGIADFNAGFGSKKYTFPNFYQNNLFFPLRYFKK